MDKAERQRSPSQNKSLHLYCQQVADTLNQHGISQEVFFRNIEADFSMETIKNLWRSIAAKKYGKTSTTELSTKQIDEIYDEVNRHLAKFSIHIPFPSGASLIDQNRHL